MNAQEIVYSIIIPVRNEEKNIARCLDAVLANDYPKDKLEIVIVDGQSTDNTSTVIQDYVNAHRHIRITVLENPQKITPTALNIGIKYSRGSIIAVVGAHNYISDNYILTAVGYLQENKADCIGGIGICIPVGKGLISESISLAAKSSFGVGGGFRTNRAKKTVHVDTVPSPVYKREVFEKIGFFNVKLVRNQDIEFNLRLKRGGGKVLLVPDIVSYYYARPDLKGLFKQNFWNGFWVIYSNRFAKMPFSYKHLVPFAFVLSLLGSFLLSPLWKPFVYMFLAEIAIYLIANVFFSLKISFSKGLKLLPVVAVAFATLHFSYGLGSLWGSAKLIFSRNRK